MAQILNSNGEPISFTCMNKKFKTNLNKGNFHQPYSKTRGNVLENPLIDTDGYSLWLEHVVDNSDREFYWLMWYDSKGKPVIPMSGVFGKEDLEHMVGQLTRFVP